VRVLPSEYTANVSSIKCEEKPAKGRTREGILDKQQPESSTRDNIKKYQNLKIPCREEDGRKGDEWASTPPG